MTWTDPDTDGQTYLRLVKAEERRSAIETRSGQRDALARMQAHWDAELGKQARLRALANLTFITQLVPERKAVAPLQWHAKSGRGK